jgi:hypothetical protein
MTFRAALGHRNIKSTMRYVAADAETVRAPVGEGGGGVGEENG